MGPNFSVNFENFRFLRNFIIFIKNHKEIWEENLGTKILKHILELSEPQVQVNLQKPVQSAKEPSDSLIEKLQNENER